jgi:phosphoglycolate phosphatase-like HAD superfamily hydrolase
VGLLTGNWREGARLKLSAINLWWEGPSAFGDDAVDRNHLVPVARRRAVEQGHPVRRVVVIGDTPKDVECARAGGAIAVAVKTGFATVESLEQSQPDLLLSDLDQGLDALLALLG